MPNIYDNISLRLLDGLCEVMNDAVAADMCVGYFNLRGWEHLADLVEPLAGTDEHCCRTKPIINYDITCRLGADEVCYAQYG